MRRFTDPDGVVWTAILGKASYGEISLLFSRNGVTTVYMSPLEAASTLEGRDLLAELSNESLRERLRNAAPWDP